MATNFDAVLSHGTWMNPASKAYVLGDTVVTCDCCSARGIAAALHFHDMDLCAACIGTLLPTETLVGKPFSSTSNTRVVGRLEADGSITHGLLTADYCPSRINVIVNTSNVIVSVQGTG